MTSLTGLDNFKKIYRDLSGRFRRLNKIEKRLDEALKIGQLRAKAAAPVLTGLLRRSIDRDVRKIGDKYVGRIFVDLSIVPYARRQNYEHRTRSEFMQKGARAAANHISGLYSNLRRIERDFFNE